MSGIKTDNTMTLYHALNRINELEACLKEARANMVDWATYVPEYFQEKNGLKDDLAAIDKVLTND